MSPKELTRQIHLIKKQLASLRSSRSNNILNAEGLRDQRKEVTTARQNSKYKGVSCRRLKKVCGNMVIDVDASTEYNEPLSIRFTVVVRQGDLYRRFCKTASFSTDYKLVLGDVEDIQGEIEWFLGAELEFRVGTGLIATNGERRKTVVLNENTISPTEILGYEFYIHREQMRAEKRELAECLGGQEEKNRSEMEELEKKLS